jgi:hypothetical protein
MHVEEAARCNLVATVVPKIRKVKSSERTQGVSGTTVPTPREAATWREV